jgi:predicted ATPase/DNA-binding winged helix-turn-helix (wHTH) protein
MMDESDEWEIDLSRRELRTRGIPVPIGGRAFEILEVLIRSAGQLVTKDELMKRVWPGAIIEDNTLQVHVSAIRKALGPDRGMLKTASGRGYRLLGNWHVRDEREPASPVALEAIDMPVRPFQTNLPAPVPKLIGRSKTILNLRDLLSAYPIVTLTGPGGIGKTTLALEVARFVFPGFNGDAWLIELASLFEPALVPSAVASVLGLELTSGQISPETIARAVGHRRLLLIFDNCEHVIEAVARLIETVVRLCPQVSVLATSREVFCIEGEYVHRVPPLDVPQSHQEQPEAILGRSAVQLFIARTLALRSDFTPQGEDFATIGAICRRLDGIPLAIEFAAARAAVLGVRQVAALLDDRFTLLTGGRRTALPRQQTLRATLDWSYDLLPEHERRLLRRLAVFAAGFTIEAAAAVTSDTGNTDLAVIDGISSLVAKSLVTLDSDALPRRWRLLETIRAYALDQQSDSREAEQTVRRHAEFFRDLLGPVAQSQPSIEDMARHHREIDDIRSALNWAFSPDGDTATGVALTIAAVPLWTHLSLMEECRRCVKQALARLEAREDHDKRHAMQLSHALGAALMYMKATPETRAAFTRALEIADSLDDPDYQFLALWGLWVDRMNDGALDDSLSLAEKLSDLASRSADPITLAIGYRTMGFTLHFLGEQTKARYNLERMFSGYVPALHDRPILRFQFDPWLTAQMKLGVILWLQGHPDQAIRTIENCIDDALAINHSVTLCNGLASGACPVALWNGDLRTAERWIAISLENAERSGLTAWQADANCLRGVLFIRRGDIAAGVNILINALDKFSSSMLHTRHDIFVAELAGALGLVGDVAGGLRALEHALRRTELTKSRWYVPEFLRIKGELALAEKAPAAEPAAEALFRQSLDLARHQRALSWELRTATSLARLYHHQRCTARASGLLEPVYARFTEGFSTADLTASRVLLDSLRE